MSLKNIKLTEIDIRKLKYFRTANLERIVFLSDCISSKNHLHRIDNERLDSFQLKDLLGDLISVIKADDSVVQSIADKLSELKIKNEAEIKILSSPSFISNEQGG